MGPKAAITYRPIIDDRECFPANWFDLPFWYSCQPPPPPQRTHKHSDDDAHTTHGILTYKRRTWEENGRMQDFFMVLMGDNRKTGSVSVDVAQPRVVPATAYTWVFATRMYRRASDLGEAIDLRRVRTTQRCANLFTQSPVLFGKGSTYKQTHHMHRKKQQDDKLEHVPLSVRHLVLLLFPSLSFYIGQQLPRTLVWIIKKAPILLNTLYGEPYSSQCVGGAPTAPTSRKSFYSQIFSSVARQQDEITNIFFFLFICAARC